MQIITLNDVLAGTVAFLAMCCVILPAHAATPERNAYFGDTHIHTMYSFDAFMGNVRTTPDDAYRYAKGEPIDHPAGMKLRITGPPLDFLMVSDHAKYLGVFAAQIDPEAHMALCIASPPHLPMCMTSPKPSNFCMVMKKAFGLMQAIRVHTNERSTRIVTLPGRSR